MRLTALTVILLISTCVHSLKAPDSLPIGYHRSVGIPTAARIKAAEDRIFSKSSSRIWYGDLVKSEEMGQYSFFAGLIIKLTDEFAELSYCGSSLVSTDRLLTAAHCWQDADENTQGENLTAVLGTNYLFHGGLRIETNKFVIHPNWMESRSLYFHDIGVVFLPEKIKFTNNIFPIALPEERDYMGSGQYGRIVGYGVHENFTLEDFVYPNLTKLELRIITEMECMDKFEINLPEYDYQFCAMGDGKSGTCDGDGGGPLYTYTNRKVLIGVLAFGFQPRCHNGGPMIFTRVTTYMDFIKSHVANLPTVTSSQFSPQENGTTIENITISVPDEDGKIYNAVHLIT